MIKKRKTIALVAGGAATLAVAATAFGAGTGGSAPAAGSRLDDGKDLLGQAKVTEQQAIAAAQRSATGDLNEVDLEHRDGKLVWNVDVGSKDVKVDASTGDVLAVDQDD
jgi:uncharacterized membrane protein YkoI